MRTRVIGIGQPLAGDDGVGHRVLEALRRIPLPDHVELTVVREASAIVPLLEGADRVVVVDAVVGAGERGRVHVLDAGQLDASSMSSVSSHGIGVAQAVELARSLAGGEAPDVRFVGVAITPPAHHREGLSPEVARAIPEAVREVVAQVS